MALDTSMDAVESSPLPFEMPHAFRKAFPPRETLFVAKDNSETLKKLVNIRLPLSFVADKHLAKIFSP